MFDKFLNTIKTQTLLVKEQLTNSASLSDLRPQSQQNAQESGKQARSVFTSISGLRKFRPSSNSTETLKVECSARNIPGSKEQLKWPVLVGNEKRWVSTSVMEREAGASHSSASRDSESDSECVLWQSEIFPQSEVEDIDEETLLEKFSRATNSKVDYLPRRNDREEIRRRLAMGIDSEEDMERLHTRKQSLQSRLQSNMNLQICFMNETASDGSDTEATSKEPTTDKADPGGSADDVEPKRLENGTSDPFCSLPALSTFKAATAAVNQDQVGEVDFFTQQAKLQMEARTALAQAKELARVQMQVERQQRKRSLISNLVRQNLEKLGLPFAWDLRRLSRQVLSELNVAQLQVIVNDLHTQIEGLNEELVQQLMHRDDFHMEQDSMLVDIEDLTRYLTAKQQNLLMDSSSSGHSSMPVTKSNQSSPSPKQRLRSLRLPSLRK